MLFVLHVLCNAKSLFVVVYQRPIIRLMYVRGGCDCIITAHFIVAEPLVCYVNEFVVIPAMDMCA